MLDSVDSMPPPQGIDYVYDTALDSLRQQLSWIDALDTKAGILIAADGVVAGVVLASDSLIAPSSVWTVLIATLLLSSLALALLAFATRRYEIAPDPSELTDSMSLGDERLLKWTTVPSVLEAIDVNEPKLVRKADLVFGSALLLLLGVAALAAYFIYWIPFRG
jgi:hypothetical protein